MATGQLVVDECVTVEEAALAARVDDIDPLRSQIASLIIAAREQAEIYVGRYFRTTVWVWEGDDWPAAPLRPLAGNLTAADVKCWDGSQMVSLPGDAYLLAPKRTGGRWVINGQGGGELPRAAPRALGPRVRIELTFSVDGSEVKECVKTFIRAQVAGWINSPDGLSSKQLQIDPRLRLLLDAAHRTCLL